MSKYDLKVVCPHTAVKHFTITVEYENDLLKPIGCEQEENCDTCQKCKAALTVMFINPDDAREASHQDCVSPDFSLLKSI